MGDTSVAADVSRALTLNHVDYCVGHPWATPEEELSPVVGEALRVWSVDRRQHLDKVTLVDERGGRGERLAAWLDRNTVRARLHSPHSVEGAALMAGPLAW